VTVEDESTGLSDDGFLGSRLQLLQPLKGHRAGSDAVLLAAAVPAVPGDRVLDAGAGVGVAGLCLMARVPNLQVTAAEADPSLCALAAQNAQRNGFGSSFEAICADVTAPGKVLSKAGLAAGTFRHVMANPPFYTEGTVRISPQRRLAHELADGGIEAWCRFFAAMTASDGELTVIHRPDCLPLLLAALAPRFGDLTLLPLYPKQGEPAIRVIIRGVKGSRAALSVLPGLILHDEAGRYTQAAEAALRHGGPLT
jgi:tRNA1(Val) A37 N6-methylase TrmN6